MNSGEGEEVKLFGYQHNHGVGSRSLHIVLSLSHCAAQPAAIIARKNENVHLTIPVDCQNLKSQQNLLNSFMPEIVGHPNVASVLLVGAGCELLPVREVMNSVMARNTAVEFIVAGESNRMSITQLFGEAALSELSAKSMPGFDYFSGSKVGIIHHGTSEILDEIRVGLDDLGITTVLQESTGESARDISKLTIAGCVAIVNFLSEEELPSASAIVPTVSIASGSELHRDLAELCDLAATASAKEITDLLRATLGRQQTKTEVMRLIAPLTLQDHVGGVR